MQVYSCKAVESPESTASRSHRAATTRGQTDGDESEVYRHEESSEKNRCKDRSSESHEGLEREHQEGVGQDGAGEEAGRQGVEGQEEQLRATGEKPARQRVRALRRRDGARDQRWRFAFDGVAFAASPTSWARWAFAERSIVQAAAAVSSPIVTTALMPTISHVG